MSSTYRLSTAQMGWVIGCVLTAVVGYTAMVYDHARSAATAAAPITVQLQPPAPTTEAPSAPATSLPIPPTAAPSADAKIEDIWRKIANDEPEIHERTIEVSSCTYNVTCLRAACTVSLAYRNLDNSDPLYLPFDTCRERGVESAMNAIIRGMSKDVEMEQ